MTKKYFVSKIEPARAMLMPEMLKCCGYDTYIAEELVQNTIIQAWCVIEDQFKDFQKLPENDPGTDAYSGRYPFTNSGDIRSVRW